MTEFLLVMVAGGLGATARFVVDSCFAPLNRHFPIGTLVVNVLGSFALGVVMGMGAKHTLTPTEATVLGVGFCGGFTTFSTAALDALRLFVAGRSRTFSVYWLLGFVMCVVAGAIGWAVGAV